MDDQKFDEQPMKPEVTLKHDGVLARVQELIKHLDLGGEFHLANSNSLPQGCNQDDRLLVPDLVLLDKQDRVSHVIEVETSTGGTTIVGKVVLANIALEGQGHKAKLVFLYIPKTPENPYAALARCRLDLVKLSTPHLESVVVKQFAPEDTSWF